MNNHLNKIRKIDPTKGATIEENTPNDMNPVGIGRTRLAFGESAKAGLEPPNSKIMPRFHNQRLVQGVNDREYDALVVFDPLNIRHTTESTNMQLLNSHNLFRALTVCAGGYKMMWDVKTDPFIAIQPTNTRASLRR